MVNLELYKIFIIVADEKNITKASKKLCISQPAVSKHIHNLESILKIKLFERSKNGIFLTSKGELFYNELKPLIEKIQEAEKKLMDNDNLNFGVHIMMLTKMYDGIIQKYYEKYPNSNINISNENYDILVEKLLDKNIDLILSKKLNSSLINVENIEYIPLGFVHDVLITNSSSNLKNKLLTKKDIKKLHIYTPRKSSITTKNLIKNLELSENDINYMTYSTLLEVIKKSGGIGVIAKEYIEKELDENEIIILNTDFKLEEIEYGIYINEDNISDKLEYFIEIIKSIHN